MADERTIVGWSWEDEPDAVKPTEAEAVADFREWVGEDEGELVLYGFARVVPTEDEILEMADTVLADLGSDLDDRFGGVEEQGGWSDQIVAKAITFIRAAVAEYEITAVESVTQKTVRIEDFPE